MVLSVLAPMCRRGEQIFLGGVYGHALGMYMCLCMMGARWAASGGQVCWTAAGAGSVLLSCSRGKAEHLAGILSHRQQPPGVSHFGRLNSSD